VKRYHEDPILPLSNPRKEDYSTGLFDCWKGPGGWNLCLMTTFLPCVTGGNSHEWLDLFGGFAGGFFMYLIWFILLPFYWIPTLWHAHETQGRLNIGDREGCAYWIKLFVFSFFCNQCLMCQLRREQIIEGRIAPTPGQEASRQYNQRYTTNNDTEIVVNSRVVISAPPDSAMLKVPPPSVHQAKASYPGPPSSSSNQPPYVSATVKKSEPNCPSYESADSFGPVSNV